MPDDIDTDTAPLLFCRTRVRREPDWFDTFIDTHTLMVVKETVQLDLGSKVRVHQFERPPVRSWAKLFRLAHANQIKTTALGDAFIEAMPQELGRLSMRMINVIKIGAQRRGGLNDLNGQWHPAPAEWLNQQPRGRILSDVPVMPSG